MSALAQQQDQNPMIRVLRNLGTQQTTTAKEAYFTRNITRLPSIYKIDLSNLHELKDAFAQAQSPDPYCVSPSYYGLTGRRGLWVYSPEGSESSVIFCLHPNRKDIVLAFPPFGEKSTEVLQDFLSEIQTLSMTVQLGRVPVDSDLEATVRKIENYRILLETEKTLDWTYPVHTITCSELQKADGQKYRHVRGPLNVVNGLSEEVDVGEINFSVQADRQMIRRLAEEWAASAIQKNSLGYDVTTDVASDYFGHLIKMARQENLNLRGLFLRVSGKPVGFSLWEDPVGPNNTANLFASQVADFTHPRLSTYLMCATSEAILRRGGEHMCLGGSETPSMDTFKRNFVPSQSLALKTTTFTPIMEAQTGLHVVKNEQPPGQTSNTPNNQLIAAL